MAKQGSSSDSFTDKSGTAKTSGTSITPFHLANNDYDTQYDVGGYEYHGDNNNNNNNVDGHSEIGGRAFSVDNSTTDGIDILAADVSPHNFITWTRQQTGRIIMNRRFKRSVLALILFNSLLLGVATLNVVRQHSRWSFCINGLLGIIQVIFTVEVSIDILHYQKKTLQQGWLLFDLAVIVSSWFVLHTLTILRAFRLIRALRKASGVAQVKQLVKALLKVVPKMLAIVFLMLTLFYIFAVLFTDMFQDLYNNNDNEAAAISQDYFGRLDKSAFTLFQIMTLDNWASITNELTAVYPWAWLPVICFITSATFFFGSLVIAVVTEAVASVGNERLWKTIEIRESQSQHHHMTTGTGTGGGGGKDVKHLEEKLDDLRATVDKLVRMQVTMQESMARMQQQEIARGLKQSKSQEAES